MANRFTRPRVLLWISALIGGAFLLTGVGIAASAPLKGLPIYLKFLLGALFFAGVVYSFYLEHKGDPIVPENRDTSPAEDREKGG